jgi:hypothetical protein
MQRCPSALHIGCDIRASSEWVRCEPGCRCSVGRAAVGSVACRMEVGEAGRRPGSGSLGTRDRSAQLPHSLVRPIRLAVSFGSLVNSEILHSAVIRLREKAV